LYREHSFWHLSWNELHICQERLADKCAKIWCGNFWIFQFLLILWGETYTGLAKIGTSNLIKSTKIEISKIAESYYCESTLWICTPIFKMFKCEVYTWMFLTWPFFCSEIIAFLCFLDPKYIHFSIVFINSIASVRLIW
jgi:hypothetical protein